MGSVLTEFACWRWALSALVVVAASASFAAAAVTQDSVATDRAALEALYDATGGATLWTNSANWNTTAPLGEWYGVATDSAGRVTTLDLGENELTGPIPEGLGTLYNLEWLDLAENALTGPIPVAGTLGSLLPNLEVLDLSGNELSGPIPVPGTLGSLSNLKLLDLSDNELTGPIPEELGSLFNLIALNLSWNELTGPIPEELGSLSNLVGMLLSGNALTGPIPEALRSLSNLESLFLNDNALTGPIPQALLSMNLERLDLADNAFTGAIPEWLGGSFNLLLFNLRSLDLSGNELMGPIPGELGTLYSLERLDLSRNELTGSIPPALGNLSNLEHLYLWGNALTGPIPDTLGNLSNVTSLVLVDNELTGPIPPALGNLSNLERLYLSRNELTGPIPPALGSLSNLERLWLSRNELTGPIPPALGNLSNLEWLSLWGNALTGPIPEALTGLSQLMILHIQDTGLCVPADIAFQRWLATIEDFMGSTCPESFSIPNLGGRSITSSGTEAETQVGYGRIGADAGSTTPSGIAIIGYRPGGVLVAEAGVPASEPVREGRIFAEVNGPVNTGLAIANPNDAPVTINFYFTDTDGARFAEGAYVLDAGRQIADFLNETPFNGGDTVLGTFTFTSSLPVAVIALRGFTNRDGEFLMTTLPVAPLAAPLTPFTTDTAYRGTVYFPHFADGSGWATQVILVNPTVRTITGTVRFLGQGSATTAATPAVRTLEDGRTGSSFEYSIPPNGSYRIVTSNPPGGVSVGSVRAIPDNGHRAPSGLVIFSFTSAGKTLLEAGVPALAAGSAFRVYVESSGTPEQIGSIRTGLAITNAADTANTVTLEVTDLDGTLAALPAPLTLPPSGQVSRFIDELFDSLPPHFSGVLRVTSTAEVAIVGLRLRYNRRGELKMTTTPPSIETDPPTMMDRYFAHIVDSRGWSTQFILFSGTAGQASSGTLSFIDTAGEPWDLPTENSVSDGSASPD